MKKTVWFLLLLLATELTIVGSQPKNQKQEAVCLQISYLLATRSGNRDGEWLPFIDNRVVCPDGYVPIVYSDNEGDYVLVKTSDGERHRVDACVRTTINHSLVKKS